ncbi:MAG TPA: hypothetical protein VJS37_15860 [Terriglobales bacterium]|nr:hypothetical protein [Terriglobales bacterium]
MNEAIRKALLILPIMLIAGCGAPGAHELVSVSVTPHAADAVNFPSGQVQFMASGIYRQPSSPVQLTSREITWCIGDASGECAGNIFTGANVDANGLVYCLSNFSGTVTVLAGQPQAPLKPDVGGRLRIFGSAQLTCP